MAVKGGHFVQVSMCQVIASNDAAIFVQGPLAVTNMD